MRIAVATGPETVPAAMEESTRLLVLETDDGSILDERPGPDPLGFAALALQYDCEAVACGKITDPTAFERPTENGVTRYHAPAPSRPDSMRSNEIHRRERCIFMRGVCCLRRPFRAPETPCAKRTFSAGKSKNFLCVFCKAHSSFVISHKMLVPSSAKISKRAEIVS